MQYPLSKPVSIRSCVREHLAASPSGNMNGQHTEEGDALSPARAASRPASIRPILAVSFVGSLGFSIVLPFLVYVVTRLGGNAVVYGVMGATYSLFQLIGAPVLGRWSDRFGRKRILLVSQLGTALSWGLFLFALALPVTALVHVDSRLLGAFTVTTPLVALFAARALDGITGGNISVANAYLADVTSEGDRAADFGRMAVSGNLGFIVGPALAGVLGATVWRETAPVAAAFLISSVACLVVAFGLKNPEPRLQDGIPLGASPARLLGQEPKDCFKGTRTDRLSAARIARIPRVPRLLILDFLVFLAFNVYYVAFPIHVVRDLHWTLPATGVFFAALSLMMVVVQGPVLTWARHRWSERTLVLTGGAVLAFGFALFGATHVPWLYAGATLLAVGNGLMWPSLLALLSIAAGREAQGAVQGLAGSGNALASILGLLIGGLLFGRLGTHVFDLSAAVTVLVCILGLGIEPSHRPGSPESMRQPGRATHARHESAN